MAKLTAFQKSRREDLRFIRDADPLNEDELRDIGDILRQQAGSLVVQRWHWQWVARLLRTVERQHGKPPKEEM